MVGFVVVGLKLGEIDGKKLGEGVGSNVGEGVGSTEGFCDGVEVVGFVEGAALGFNVGPLVPYIQKLL